jgi:hypothetical protein
VLTNSCKVFHQKSFQTLQKESVNPYNLLFGKNESVDGKLSDIFIKIVGNYQNCYAVRINSFIITYIQILTEHIFNESLI